MSLPSANASSPRIIIVGTGFAGLCMGVRLKRAGIDSFTIYEQGSTIGGTWRDNDYPGAACDVQSHLYSFSFEPNPRWSRMFAEQGEIRAYLEHCADKYALRPHIQLNTSVTAARFDEKTSTWTVTLQSGERVEADLLVTATGGLSRPAYPDIPGLRSFEGTLFHSARWNHDFDLTDKTVGVIGTGASSIQFVPQIAPRVKQLALFQRTPPWVVSKPDRAIGHVEQAAYKVLPALQWCYRVLIYWLLELRVLGFVVNPKVMEMPQRQALEFLKQSVPDPELRAKLTPNYLFGCKRVLMSNDYFPALNRANVDVVTSGIREITRDGVITVDGTHRKLDALILGTGFAAAEAAAPFAIAGVGGVDLNEHWKDGAEAYVGTAIAGYPNLFTIVGPNTGLGHTSLVFIIEAQVEHVMQALQALRRNDAKWIEVRQDVQDRFNRRLHQRMARSVWASGCASWYQTKSGKNTTLWPGFTFTFRKLTARALDSAHYHFGAGAATTAPESEAPRAMPAMHADHADA